MLNTLQLRIEAQTAIGGQSLPLRFYDTVEKVIADEDSVRVLIRTVKVKELARETRIVASGRRIIKYTPYVGYAGIKLWRILPDDDITVWDDDFVPVSQDVRRRVLTPDEHKERRDFEAECYRPGAKSFPMDNYDRTVFERPAFAAPKMLKHWDK